MYNKRQIERALPYAIFLVFFPCLGVLFVALPSSKSPVIIANTSQHISVSSTLLPNANEDDNTNLGLILSDFDSYDQNLDSQPDFTTSEQIISPQLFLEEDTNRETERPSFCNPPILQPDGSSMPTYELPQRTCLEKNGQNPIAVAVMEVRDPDDRTKKINRSVIIPLVKNNPSMSWQSAAAMKCFITPVVPVDDFAIRFGEPQPLGRLPVHCPFEVFHVNCTYPNSSSVLQEDTTRWETFSGIFRCMIPSPVRNNNPTRNFIPQRGRRSTKFEERLNIILIGLDSLSRVTWLDQLPRTSQYVTENLGAITLEGYNIVGDGTTVAFLALFAGRFYGELHESRRGFPNASAIDDFPFLWKQLKEQSNYVTLYDEDQPTIGEFRVIFHPSAIPQFIPLLVILFRLGTFQHRMMGFNKKPVDYYGRYFQLAFKDKSPRIYDCMGSSPTFDEMLNQIKHMFLLHPDPQRKFALIFNGANSRPAFDGTQDVTHLDRFILANIQGLVKRGFLNNSLLILFSDHGARNGKNRASARGKFEERMPYMTLIFPRWFLQKYPNYIRHLKDASRKMTTPFDVHKTLQEIGGIRDVTTLRNNRPRGLSLFQPLPKDRTCNDAGVLPHWCSCNIGNPSFSDFADNIMPNKVDNIPYKSFLEAFKKFADEALLPVEELCEPLVPRDPFIVSKMPGDLVQISFYTDPGNGQWEVTFSVDRSDEQNIVITVADSSQISRTNSYGAAPFCIRETYPHLREFCYCKALSQR